MKLPYCTRCNQPRTPEQLHRGICGACRRHRCTKHQPGARACYAHDNCRCDPCCGASFIYDKRRRLGLTGQTVDAEPTKRRIRAMLRIGWRAEDIAKAGRWTTAQSVLEMLDKARLNSRSVARIAAVYERLEGTAGPSDMGRRRAEKKGWPPPLAWDDGTGPHGIDNPQATPYPTSRGRRDVSEVIEEVRQLWGTDTIDSIAKRLGYADRKSLSKVVRRAGEAQLATRIEREWAA